MSLWFGPAVAVDALLRREGDIIRVSGGGEETLRYCAAYGCYGGCLGTGDAILIAEAGDTKVRLG